MPRGYIQIVDGEWVIIEWSKQREQCCDCGLVHDVDHRVVNGDLEFRATVNRRATRLARRMEKPKRAQSRKRKR